jgi:hypothetical protein
MSSQTSRYHMLCRSQFCGDEQFNILFDIEAASKLNESASRSRLIAFINSNQSSEISTASIYVFLFAAVINTVYRRRLGRYRLRFNVRAFLLLTTRISSCRRAISATLKKNP